MNLLTIPDEPNFSTAIARKLLKLQSHDSTSLELLLPRRRLQMVGWRSFQGVLRIRAAGKSDPDEICLVIGQSASEDG